MAATRLGRVGALVLLGALVALAGCAGAGKEPVARGLNGEEAERLIASQLPRSRETASEPVSDPAQLEALGDQQVRQGQALGALYQYHRALGLMAEGDSRRGRLLAKLAEVYLQGRQFAPAHAACQGWCQTEPANPLAWQGLGLAALGQGRTAEAREALARALALDPSLWKAHNALGVIHDRENRPEEALKAFERALSLAPRSPQILNNRGLARLMLGDPLAAERDLRQALALDPAYRLAANNLALALARQGRMSEAFRAFAQGGGAAEAHHNLGCLLAFMGSYQKAAEEFQKALGARPRYYQKAGRQLELLNDRLAAEGGDSRPTRVIELPIAPPDVAPAAPPAPSALPAATPMPLPAAPPAKSALPRATPVSLAAAGFLGPLPPLGPARVPAAILAAPAVTPAALVASAVPAAPAPRPSAEGPREFPAAPQAGGVLWRGAITPVELPME